MARARAFGIVVFVLLCLMEPCQAQFVLPKGTKWQGLKLRAELEVKGMRYPVRWACHQKVNDDGSLTLRPNLHQGV